jgi:hypothetical protein
MNITDIERAERDAVEREHDFDRPTRAEAEADARWDRRPCPDIMGRDLDPYDPSEVF